MKKFVKTKRLFVTSFNLCCTFRAGLNPVATSGSVQCLVRRPSGWRVGAARTAREGHRCSTSAVGRPAMPHETAALTAHALLALGERLGRADRKSTRLNSSH